MGNICRLASGNRNMNKYDARTTLPIIFAFVILVLCSLGCSKKGGVIGEVFCPTTGSPPSADTASFTIVRMHRPPVLEPVFQLYRSDRLGFSWAKLLQMKGATENIDLTVTAVLPEPQAPGPIALQNITVQGPGSEMENVRNYVIGTFRTWQYTPFMWGDITFRLHVGGRLFQVNLGGMRPASAYPSDSIGVLWDISDAKAFGVQLRKSRGIM